MLLGGLAFACLLTAAPNPAKTDDLATLEGVTFHSRRGVLYVPIRQLSASFGRNVHIVNGAVFMGRSQIDVKRSRRLIDGTLLYEVPALRNHGYIVNWDAKKGLATVKEKASPGKAVFVRRGDQRVVINKGHKSIAAWQGTRVVFRSQVGIGRIGYTTPSGNFKVQNYRARMHRSSLYENAPMPWSVHIVGNIFVHGSDVARGRSSHGCIRLPVSNPNAAKWFYDWVETGAPVLIQGTWPDRYKG